MTEGRDKGIAGERGQCRRVVGSSGPENNAHGDGGIWFTQDWLIQGFC
jgi:hypothetical protein